VAGNLAGPMRVPDRDSDSGMARAELIGSPDKIGV